MKKFRGHLELVNGTIVDLVNDDQAILKDTVQDTLKGACRFEPAGTASEPSLLIYHPSLGAGKTVIGWIAAGVNEGMSNKAFVEQRRLQVAA